MRIENLSLHNFRTFQHLELKEIPPLAVFVGDNGAGKTTLFDVFSFLQDCLTHNVEHALQARGGYGEVVSRGHEGEDIIIEIQCHLPVDGTPRFVTYHVEIVQNNNRPVVGREFLRYKLGTCGAPCHVLRFSHGKGYAIVDEEATRGKLGRKEHELGADNVLAIKELGQLRRYRGAYAMRQMVESWHVSDLCMDAARNAKDRTAACEHLWASLQPVAPKPWENLPEAYAKIRKAMGVHASGLTGAVPYKRLNGRPGLQFGGTLLAPFDRRACAGTMELLACLVLLHGPNPHIVCLEELEAYLSPSQLVELANYFRAYADRSGQVLLSLHSPMFLDDMGLDKVFWIEKGKFGFSTIVQARQDPRSVASMKQGERRGELWKRGALDRKKMQRNFIPSVSNFHGTW